MILWIVANTDSERSIWRKIEGEGGGEEEIEGGKEGVTRIYFIKQIKCPFMFLEPEIKEGACDMCIWWKSKVIEVSTEENAVSEFVAVSWTAVVLITVYHRSFK